MMNIGLKRILRLIGLVWLMALSIWIMMRVVNGLALFGSGQAIISTVGLLLLGSTALAFILGGSGK